MSATNNKEIAAKIAAEAGVYTPNLLHIGIIRALDLKDAKIKRLEDALRFYAEGTPTQIGCDRGKLARQALGGE